MRSLGRLFFPKRASAPSSPEDGEGWYDTGLSRYRVRQGGATRTLATDADVLTWRGQWSNLTAYIEDDVVEWNGSSYVCTAAHTNQQPPNASYWDLVAEKGTQGDAGGAFTQTIGDGSNTSFTVTHNFNTRAVAVVVRRNAVPYDQVWAGLSATADTVNTVVVSFDTPPAAGEFVVTVISGTGQQGPAGPTGPAGADGVGQPGTATPLMDGTAAVGSSGTHWAREDHRHPTDTSRAPAVVTETGIIIPTAMSVQDALRQVEEYLQNLEERFEQHHHDERYSPIGTTLAVSQSSNVSSSSSAWFDVPGCSLTIGPGVWLVFAECRSFRFWTNYASNGNNAATCQAIAGIWKSDDSAQYSQVVRTQKVHSEDRSECGDLFTACIVDNTNAPPMTVKLRGITYVQYGVNFASGARIDSPGTGATNAVITARRVG